jgi:hypothetical protein
MQEIGCPYGIAFRKFQPVNSFIDHISMAGFGIVIEGCTN